MSVWKRLLASTYAIGNQRRWWVWVVVAAALVSLLQLLPRPWNWIGTAPLVIFLVLLLDGHARWQRDEVRQRTSQTGV